MLLQTYINSKHSITGLTPFFVTCGRHACLPVEVLGVEALMLRMDLDGWVRHHHDQLRWAYSPVETRTRYQQEQEKQRYDKQAKDLPLMVAERVLLQNFR